MSEGDGGAGADLLVLGERALEVDDEDGGFVVDMSIRTEADRDGSTAFWIGATSTGALRADMVVTVEPGVYLEGRGGVRIEDTLVVRDGEPDCLTRTPRELLEV